MILANVVMDANLRKRMKFLGGAGALAGMIVSLQFPLRAQDKSAAIQRLYSEAQSAEHAGQLQTAVDKYRDIIKLDPGLPAAHNNLGQLLFQQGQFDLAVPELQRACKLNPDSSVPRALLGFTFYQMDNFTAAREQLEVASRLNPHDRRAKLFLARSLVSLGQPIQAERLLEELQRDDPDDPEVLFSLGSLYSSLAESTLGKIQTVSPDSYLIEVLLAKVAATRGLYGDAAEHYKNAIARSPQNSELYYQYGHALWASKSEQEALQAFQHALKLNPYDFRASWEAGRIVLPQDPEDASRLVTNALRLNPNLPEALKVRGEAWLALHHPREAIDDFKKASTIDPQDDSLHFQLARAYRQAGSLDEARREDAIFEQMEIESHTPKAN